MGTLRDGCPKPPRRRVAHGSGRGAEGQMASKSLQQAAMAQLRRDTWAWSLTSGGWYSAQGENCAVPNGAACAYSDDIDGVVGCNSAYKPVFAGSFLPPP